jgi:hypothetical protein
MNGVIRKIVVGPDPKNGMAYYVGMRVQNGEISAIVFDDVTLHKHSVFRYVIYVSTDEGTEIWKVIEGLPCLVENDLNF